MAHASIVRRSVLAVTFWVLGTLASAAAAGAQQPAPPATAADVAALTRLIEQQRARLEQQGKVIEDLKSQLEATSKMVTASQQRLTELEQKAAGVTPPPQTQAAAPEQTIAKRPELTPQTLSASDFPNAFPIPGTDAAIRFGGQVRTVFVRNLRALGTEDRFVTSSIPITGTPEAAKESRTTITASPSRFETDLRTPTAVGQLRAFLSGDFAGDRRTFRLRHAFGQWQGFLIGQTWSAFSDPEAEPDGLDFEGLNAISLFRQPGIRWSKRLNPRMEFAIAIENPSPDITGASGVNQIPDLIARIRFNAAADPSQSNGILGANGHIQAAVLLRQVRGEPEGMVNHILSTGGVGVHVSGRLPAAWRPRDYVKFATAAGTGIGRYITDLGTLGGQDAVYDSIADRLVSLPVYSAYVGYEHSWTDKLRSTGTFGLVIVDNVAIQTLDSLYQTTRSSFNVSFSPVSRVDLIAEVLAGRRVNKDRQDGRAGQVQLGWIFRF